MFTENLINKKVITPNSRMAEQLIEKMSTAEMDGGSSVVLKADVNSLSNFIKDIYARLRFVKGYETLPPLVDSSYVFMAFVKAIRNQAPDVIMDAGSLASEAATTFKNIKMWNIEIYAAENVDHEYFKLWSSAVEADLKQLNVVLEWTALDTIISALTKGDLTFPKSMAFFGFDDYPPKIKQFIEALVLTGHEVSYPWYDIKPAAVKEYTLASTTEKSHFEDVARLAYNLYKKEPNKRIAIVHPELHQADNHLKIEAALSNVFEPQYILPQTPAYTQPYNISYGASISSIPLVAVVLDLLSLLSGQLSLAKTIKVITSPFIKGYQEEKLKRNKVVTSLMSLGRQEFNIDQMIKDTSQAVLLNNQLRGVRTLLDEVKASLHISEWVGLIVNVLQKLGWADGRKLNSIEYQTYIKFSDALMVVKKHDLLFGPMGYATARGVIEMYLSSIAFNAEGDKTTPISVTGILEAGGLEFDTVIFMQMDDSTWPSVAKPTSFLPISLQEAYQLPHSCPERELDFATKITKRIKSSAKQVIYGYFTMSMGEENSPSFVIGGENVPDAWLKQPDIDYMQTETRKTPCMEVTEVMMPLPAGKVKGGVGILEEQAKCPFKAAMIHKLGLKSYPVAKQGLTHIEQGNILHAALETFWIKHKSQTALLEMDDQLLMSEITSSLEDAFILFERYHIVGEALVRLEIERMKGVLWNVMQIEKQRPPFIVESVEQSSEIDIAGIVITFRTDRTDMVDLDGSGDFEYRLKIDNKKGAVSLAGMGENLYKPQLPVQAIYDDEDVDGVAYFSLKDNEEQLVGLSNHELFDGITKLDKADYRLNLPSDWDEVKEMWQANINKLARDFKNGVMDILPINKQECIDCKYKGLCRKFAR